MALSKGGFPEFLQALTRSCAPAGEENERHPSKNGNAVPSYSPRVARRRSASLGKWPKPSTNLNEVASVCPHLSLTHYPFPCGLGEPPLEDPERDHRESFRETAALVNFGQSAHAPRSPQGPPEISPASQVEQVTTGDGFPDISPEVRRGDHWQSFRGNGRSGRLRPCRFFLHALPIPVIGRKPAGSPVFFLFRQAEQAGSPPREKRVFNGLGGRPETSRFRPFLTTLENFRGKKRRRGLAGNEPRGKSSHTSSCHLAQNGSEGTFYKQNRVAS
jgi:hypothetical protein